MKYAELISSNARLLVAIGLAAPQAVLLTVAHCHLHQLHYSFCYQYGLDWLTSLRRQFTTKRERIEPYEELLLRLPQRITSRSRNARRKHIS
jgi:hypothetical protein